MWTGEAWQKGQRSDMWTGGAWQKGQRNEHVDRRGMAKCGEHGGTNPEGKAYIYFRYHSTWK